MPEQSSIPDDVVWARGARFHLQAVYASAGIVALLTFLGVAAVLMAGPLASDPPVTAGILALLIGGVCAIEHRHRADALTCPECRGEVIRTGRGGHNRAGSIQDRVDHHVQALAGAGWADEQDRVFHARPHSFPA